MMASRFENLLDTMSLSLDTQSTGPMVVELPLDPIASDPNNPRQSFSDAELAEMAESIKAHGVLQPIVVRQVEGEQRYIIRFADSRFRIRPRHLIRRQAEPRFFSRPHRFPCGSS